jgi:hypothetical protein
MNYTGYNHENPGQGVIFGVNGTGDKFIAGNNDTGEIYHQFCLH